MYRDRRLIDHVVDALGHQTQDLIVCGRTDTGHTWVADLPEPGLGPLGGLNAAFKFAAARGFTHVLSAGVDVPNLPHDLAQQLNGEGAGIVADQPVVGLWPVTLAQDLNEYLDQGRRALFGFAEFVSARHVAVVPSLLNINRPEDMA